MISRSMNTYDVAGVDQRYHMPQLEGKQVAYYIVGHTVQCRKSTYDIIR